VSGNEPRFGASNLTEQGLSRHHKAARTFAN
jgi:hypothetical protein